MSTTFQQVFDQLARSIPDRPDAITDPDGVPRCPVCGDSLSCTVSILGELRTVRCVCSCIRKQEAERKQRERMEQIERNRDRCFRGFPKLKDATFRTDNGHDTHMTARFKTYAERFYRGSDGLLLSGPPGTGKSYYAAMIANAVIDKGYTVRLDNFINLDGRLLATWDKEEIWREITEPDLLILDDLGAERSSEHMREVVYQAIDKRYNTGMPLIVTTNLSAKDFNGCKDTDRQRIYNRLIEICSPVVITGENQRIRKREERKK